MGAGTAVVAEYTNGKTEDIVVCTESEEIKMPMSVIVNQNTAGTSELFALVLSEKAAAHTVGKTTAGKGYLQTAYTCSDGSVVMLSTADLRTEKGDSFNGIGVKPEFDVSLSSDIDLNTISEEAAVLTDAQLIKALEVTVPDEAVQNVNAVSE